MARTNATVNELAPEDPQAAAVANPWEAVMANPRTAAALLNFGLAAMQPPSFGDNFGSQVGRAIGSGAEAVGRQEEMDRRQQEADTKAMLREQQANLAAERARTAGAGLSNATMRLQNEQLRQQGLQERAQAGNYLRAYVAHNVAKARHDRAEADKEKAAVFTGQPYVAKPYPEFNPSAYGVAPPSGIEPPSSAGSSSSSAGAAAASGGDYIASDGKGNRVRWDPNSNTWVKI